MDVFHNHDEKLKIKFFNRLNFIIIKILFSKFVFSFQQCQRNQMVAIPSNHSLMTPVSFFIHHQQVFLQ